MASLQDQLLQAGIVDEKKAKQLAKEKRKAARQQPKGQQQVNETREQVAKAAADKAERDRASNRKIQQAAEAKALAAQIRQLIALNRIDRGNGDTAFQFADAGKIKKIYVTPALLEQLSKGQIAVTAFEGAYQLVPAAVANKIAERDASLVLVLNAPSADAVDGDDPYADYQIPDDLMW